MFRPDGLGRGRGRNRERHHGGYRNVFLHAGLFRAGRLPCVLEACRSDGHPAKDLRGMYQHVFQRAAAADKAGKYSVLVWAPLAVELPVWALPAVGFLDAVLPAAVQEPPGLKR